MPHAGVRVVIRTRPTADFAQDEIAIDAPNAVRWEQARGARVWLAQNGGCAASDFLLPCFQIIE
jgi:hypothetical protein